MAFTNTGPRVQLDVTHVLITGGSKCTLRGYRRRATRVSVYSATKQTVGSQDSLHYFNKEDSQRHNF